MCFGSCDYNEHVLLSCIIHLNKCRTRNFSSSSDRLKNEILYMICKASKTFQKIRTLIFGHLLKCSCLISHQHYIILPPEMLP